MAKYKITSKTGESYLIDSPSELSQEELSGYAENPMGDQKPATLEPASNVAPVEQTQTEKYGAAGALFPATVESTERGGGFIPRVISGAGDVLTLPARAASAVATGAGTIVGGGKLSTAAKEAARDLSRTKSEESGTLGFVQDMALDPTSSPVLMGAGTAVRTAKAIPTIGKALFKTAGAGAGYGAGSGAYQQAKEGKVEVGKTVGQAVLGAGVGAAATGLGKAVQTGAGKLLKNTAIRSIDIALRPGQYGRKIGYNHENVVKYDLVGTPRETYEKATEKLKSLQAAAKEIASESDAKFNISQIFDDVKATISPKDNPEEYSRQMILIDDAKQSYIEAFGEIVDAPTAMKIRTKIGEKSAFVGRTFGGSKVDPDADWKEDVYNSLYMKMKNTLHDNLGGELKEINKAQSEIIPVKQVAERRMPISESNQRIGLPDLLTTRVGQAAVGGAIGAGVGAGSTGGEAGGTIKGLAIGAALAGGRRALGSPAATKTFYKIGEAITPKVKTIPSVSKAESKNQVVNEVKEKLPEELSTPTYKRKGVDVEKNIKLETGVRIAEQAKKYRITPEQYQKIESDILSEEQVATAAKETLKKAKEAAIEADIYLENLEKKPVITIDELRNKSRVEKMNEGKRIKRSGNKPGDVSAWHKLGDNPTIGESIPVRGEKKKTIGDIIGNERGAVGGMSDNFVGTPAIRDPETGKIYTGGWRGHKDAITKGETSAIQERLKHQHFLDNSDKPTENVGFVDKKGNFISRSEAEKIAELPKSPLQMFHDESGAVGGNPQIHTENFKNWFGDWKKEPAKASKVVDEKGEPLVVYHGTSDGRYLDKEAVFKSKNERFGMGSEVGVHWFAKSDRVARSYADDRRAFDYQNAVPKTIPAYLNLKNPLVIDAKGQKWRDAQRRGKTSDVIEEAIKAGNDGVIIRRVRDNYNNNDTSSPTDTYAVFSSNQIKSATGNSGKFSKTVNDIRGSSALKTFAATGAAAGAGLTGVTIGEALKSKKKK
jgi:hypothetical protein